MTTEQIETEIEPVEQELQTDDALLDIDAPDVQFISTGSETRDRAIKGIFYDAPRLIKDASKAGKWETICKNANPAGAAELFAIAACKDVKEDDVLTILKKVKTNLLGLHKTVIQAYQHSILEEQVARVIGRKQEILPVETPVSLAITPLTITNDSGESYTFGKRGRKPLWVVEWIAKNGKPAESKVDTPIVQPVQTTPVEDKTEVKQIVKTGNVLTNVDGTTYELGKRGRKPLWVVDFLKGQPTTEQETDPQPVEQTEHKEKCKYTKKPEIVKNGCTLKGHKLTNKDGDKYWFGRKGRRPQWVIDWVEKNEKLIPE